MTDEKPEFPETAKTDEQSDDPRQVNMKAALEEEIRLLNTAPEVLLAQVQHLNNRVVSLNVKVRELQAENDTLSALKGLDALADADGVTGAD